jgi:hypothetical protein
LKHYIFKHAYNFSYILNFQRQFYECRHYYPLLQQDSQQNECTSPVELYKHYSSGLYGDGQSNFAMQI